jgi:tetratricopeptide (TPR) repeat protein
VPAPGSGGEANAHLLGQLLGIDFSASPHLKGLLGDPQALRNRALESLVDYFSAVCIRVPAVIFLEDIHWADDSSLDVINFLGRRSQNLPLLVVLLARPSLLERRPHWAEGQLYHRLVHLEPLTKRESRQLVEEILQKLEQVPVALRELVVSGAEGNPFYIEELVKMLVEQGVIVKEEPHWRVHAERLAQVDVPSTLTGVLQARLDSLPAEERAVLQQASVVGRVFWDRVVEHLHSHGYGERRSISPLLTGLRLKEMVFRREESAFAEAREYIFKHEVLREVTYETVLKKLRRQYHGWVADWLIDQGAGGGEEFAGPIAEHLERAGRRDQARDYFRQAGEAALAGYANAEAAHYFRRALDLDPPQSIRPVLLGGLADALQRQGYRDEAFQAWREGISLYLSQRDLEGATRYYTVMIRSLLPNWPIEAARQIEHALSAVEGLQESPALGHLLHQAARGYLFNGDDQRSGEFCRQALEIADRFDDPELEADALTTMGILLLNQPEEARKVLLRAIELAETHHFLYIAGRANNNLGVVYSRSLSDTRASHAYHVRALEFYKQRGAAEDEVFALGNVLDTYIKQGNLSAAQDILRELERVHQKIPQPELTESYVQNGRSWIARLRGQLEEAHEPIVEVLTSAWRIGQVQEFYTNTTFAYIPLLLDLNRYQGWEDWPSIEWILEEFNAGADLSIGVYDRGGVEARLSAVYARQGRLEQAHRWLQRAQAQVASIPLGLVQTFVLLAEMELAVSEGRLDQALTKSESLLDWYTQAGMRWDQAHTLLEMGEIHRMRSDPEQAMVLYQQARDIFAEIGATGYVDIVDGRLQMLE